MTNPRSMCLAGLGLAAFAQVASGQTVVWAEDFESRTVGNSFGDIQWYAFDGASGPIIRTVDGVVADGNGGGQAAALGVDSTLAGSGGGLPGFFFAGLGAVFTTDVSDAFADDFGTTDLEQVFVSADAKGLGFLPGVPAHVKVVYSQRDPANGGTPFFRAEWVHALTSEDVYQTIGGALADATITTGDASAFVATPAEFEFLVDFVNPGSAWGFDASNVLTIDNVEVFSLTNTPVLAGDYNGNGQVEQGDLDLVLQHWGLDATGNVPAGWVHDLPSGVIEQMELDRVLQGWGGVAAPGGAPHAVPEPMAGACLIGAIAAWRRRR